MDNTRRFRAAIAPLERPCGVGVPLGVQPGACPVGMFTLKVPGRPVEKLTLGIPGRPGTLTVGGVLGGTA